jgi:hypothetical protein
MIKFHDKIPIRSGFAVMFHTCMRKNVFLESASLIGLLLYSIWSRLGLSLKALVV